jgi:hypothetical protein
MPAAVDVAVVEAASVVVVLNYILDLEQSNLKLLLSFLIITL